MKLRLLLLSVMLLVTVVSWPVQSSAQTTVETMTTLQARIRALQAQIEAWKTRFSVGGTPSVSVDGGGQVSVEAVPLIARPGAGVCTPFVRDLKQGSSDAATSGEVSKLQTFLKAQGLFPAGTPVTGYLGPVTIEAVKKFQLQEKLPVRLEVAANASVQTDEVRTLEAPVVDSVTRAALTGKYCYLVTRGVIKPLLPRLVGSSIVTTPANQDGGEGYDTTSLRIVTPNGGETLTPGQTYTIRWASTNTALSGQQVSINLRQGMKTEPVATIATNIANQGSFDWTVPASVVAGTDYRIALFTRDPNNGRFVYDRSDAYFAIGSGPTN